jgi:hypothetical protein
MDRPCRAVEVPRGARELVATMNFRPRAHTPLHTAQEGLHNQMAKSLLQLSGKPDMSMKRG